MTALRLCVCGHPDVVHHLPAGRNKTRSYCVVWSPTACQCKKYTEEPEIDA